MEQDCNASGMAQAASFQVATSWLPVPVIDLTEDESSSDVMQKDDSNETSRAVDCMTIAPEEVVVPLANHKQTIFPYSSADLHLHRKVAPTVSGSSLRSEQDEERTHLRGGYIVDRVSPVIEAEFRQHHISSRQSGFSCNRLDALYSGLKPFTHYEGCNWIPVHRVVVNDDAIVSGAKVELKCGCLLKIASLLHLDGTDWSFILGERFDKLSAMGNMFDHWKNEVCRIDDLRGSDEKELAQSSLFITSVHNILKEVEILFTNYRPDGSHMKLYECSGTKDSYVCRIKRKTRYKEHIGSDKSDWSLQKAEEYVLEFLRSDECSSKGAFQQDSGIRDDFRKETIKPGGSAQGISEMEQVRYEDEHNLSKEASHRLGNCLNKNGIWLGKLQRPEYRGQFPSKDLFQYNMTGPGSHCIVRDSAGPRNYSSQEIGYVRGSEAWPIQLDDSLSEPTYEEDEAYDGSFAAIGLSTGACANDFATYEGEVDRFYEYTKVDHDTSKSSENTHTRRYTFGDAFCGGGGASRGAFEAGFNLSWAFDSKEEMCKCYWQNFPWVRVANADAHSFITNRAYGWKVDVLHLSPPCKFYSPAHTIDGKDDEANTAASFVIAPALLKFKPRIATLEQTVGLSNEKHIPYRDAVIRQFITCGYSVRWKVFNLADFGVPQNRQRLIIIGSCPGEALPTFPKPTHKYPAGPSKEHWNAIDNAIKGTIPDNWSLHDVDHAIRISNGNKCLPFDGQTKLARTLTTKGGYLNFHPSGERHYTVRELAMLQTFPIWHKFESTSKTTVIKEQIGNAVPPLFAKTFFEHILKFLRKEDGLQTENSESSRHS